MSQFPRAVFKADGCELIDGERFTSAIAHDADQLQARLADGWHLSTAEAKQTQQSEAQDTTEEVEALPSREDLERKARELGIEFHGRLGDKKLAERIAAKLAE